MSDKPGSEVPQSYWNVAIVVAVVLAVVVLVAMGIFLGVLRW